MLQNRVGGLMVGLVLVAGLLAGCVGDADTPPTPSSDADQIVDADTPGNVTEVDDGLIVEVDTEEAVFAPDWQAGWGWTYDAKGAWLDYDYSFTIGVTEATPNMYAMATDSDDELMTHITRAGSMFLDGVKPGTLEIMHQDAARDLFGIKRKVGATWEAALFGVPFQLTKKAPTEITDAVGTAQGILVKGASGTDDNITIQYGGAAGFLSKLEITDSAGALLYSLELTSFSDSVAGLKAWEVTDMHANAASGSPNYVGPHLTWTSNGAGDKLFLRVAPGTSEQGRGNIVGPDGQEKLASTSTEGVKTLVVDDLAGDWFTTAMNAGQNASGNRCDTQIFQITETTF